MSAGTITVFGALFSPFVRKVHVVAEEKGIAVQALPGNGPAASAEFLAASPFRKIPAMQHGDFTLADSTAIATYLDALQPTPALYPAEPKPRGRAVFFEEFADTVLAAAGGKVVFNRVVKPRLMKMECDEDAVSQGLAELVPLMAWFEGAAPETGWLVGGAFSIADISVASVFTTLAYGGVVIDAGTHPRSAAWLARVQERPTWQAVAAREAVALKGFL
ncbi:glutathione S-transferase family protein [Novosphingobium sp.]|uniref:glutathione S-transferase family protein n=1 Tax=Novosphingobium sp. TaxID=1874826 RepID=UPI0025F3235A|nr:glutathione S-transferase family protein [Novosphingobium sp.]